MPQSKTFKVDALDLLGIYELLGKPFKDGARGPESFDCWGLVKEVWHRFGIEIPDYQVSCFDAPEIDKTIQSERSRWLEIKTPTFPCLVVLRFNQAVLCNHCGVWIGDGKFIHAREKTGVVIDRLYGPAWEKKIAGFFIPDIREALA